MSASSLHVVKVNHNTVLFKLSRYLATILRPLANSEYNIRKADQLRDDLKKLKLHEDEILVSFDVISLFTKIPKARVIHILSDRWEEIAPHTTRSRWSFMTLIKLCIDRGNYFACNGQTYVQTAGLPMGSSLSPILATIVLDALIDHTKRNLGDQLIFIKKYVDDFIAVVKKINVDRML